MKYYFLTTLLLLSLSCHGQTLRELIARIPSSDDTMLLFTERPRYHTFKGLGDIKDITLIFLNSTNYAMDFRIGSDLTFSGLLIVSGGNYTIERDTIKLTDTILGLTMIFVEKENCMRAIQTFAFLEGWQFCGRMESVLRNYGGYSENTICDTSLHINAGDLTGVFVNRTQPKLIDHWNKLVLKDGQFSLFLDTALLFDGNYDIKNGKLYCYPRQLPAKLTFCISEDGKTLHAERFFSEGFSRFSKISK